MALLLFVVAAAVLTVVVVVVFFLQLCQHSKELTTDRNVDFSDDSLPFSLKLGNLLCFFCLFFIFGALNFEWPL